MKLIRCAYKLLYFILSIFILCVCKLCICIFTKNTLQQQKRLSKLISFLSYKLMFIINCKVVSKGLEHIKKNTNYLIVANHVSYIDIIILNLFLQNHRFISYKGLKKNLLFNFIFQLTNPFIINKNNIGNIRKELKEISSILKTGNHVVFFPEGGCTNGSQIKPFYPLFFATAVSAHKTVLPCCITYTKINNQTISTKNRDLVFWYKTGTDTKNPVRINFFKHCLRLFTLKSIEVNVTFLSPISTKNNNSRMLAFKSREQIYQNFTPIKPI